MYYIEETKRFYRIHAEEHGEIYPSWREFSTLLEKLQTSLTLIRAAPLLGNLSKINGIGEPIATRRTLDEV